MPLIGYAARRFPFWDRSEVISAGCVGYAEARRRYDRDLGVPFDAFALLKVRSAMCDALRKICPRHGGTHSHRGREFFTMFSLDTGKSTDKHERQTIARFFRVSPIQERRLMYQAVHRAIRQLPPRLAYVIRCHYYDGEKLSTIAKRFHCTYSNVHKMRNDALRLLRQQIGEN